MEAEWDPVLLEISAYKETGTYIMKSGEETAQMLDDHIVMTQVGGEVFCPGVVIRFGGGRFASLFSVLL